MFGIITMQHQSAFEAAIGDSNVFHWDGQSIRDNLDAAARVHIQTLIVDIDAAPIDQLTMALRSFRRQRPHTRIIIFGCDKQPGDPDMARCVALGIYDIAVLHTEDLDEEEIDTHITDLLQEKIEADRGTYADAAKWDSHIHEELPTGKSKKSSSLLTKETVKETVIIKERLIGTPVIAITGAHPGAGTTYCALQICMLLSQHGSVAYVELESVHGMTRDESNRPLEIDGLEIWRLPSLVHLPPRYNYIVVNVGTWPNRTEEVISEMRRASKAFITTGSSFWRYQDLANQVDSLLEVREDWNVLLQTPSSRQEKEIQKDMAKLEWSIFPVPYQPEPFVMMEDSQRVFEEALAAYMPKKQNRPSLLGRLFARS